MSRSQTRSGRKTSSEKSIEITAACSSGQKRAPTAPSTGAGRMSGTLHLPRAGRMMLLGAVASTMLSAAALAGPPADAQGWGGPGWYVSSDAPAQPGVAPAYILFNGPQDSRPGCEEVYYRLYSPIGTCRHLDVKPGSAIQ